MVKDLLKERNFGGIMHKIAVKDFPTLDLGDKRRDERFIKIIENIVRHPGGSIPQHNERWYDTKATYEFFKNENIKLESLTAAISGFGVSQIEQQQLLVIHDTSTISYNDLQAEGLGYIDNAAGKGIFCHSSIAATVTGIPLGLLHQLIWSRESSELGKSANRRQKPFEDKESYKWYQGIETVNQLLGEEIVKIHIGDREADIYELFFNKPDEKAELLIRARHNRKTAAGSELWQHISKQKVAAEEEIIIPDRTGKRKRKVQVQVRYKEVEILRPAHKEGKVYKSVVLTAIEIRQKGNSKDGIHWKLLTTLAINNAEEAKQCMRWYNYRWLIERFHYVLKSGCGIESLQLKKAESLMKAVAVYSLAAFNIMQLTYQSRQTPDASCEIVLRPRQWEALYMLKFKTNKLPKQPPTLQEATRWLAQMGGYLGRKSDGPPGLKTVWLGYESLLQAVALYEVLKKFR
jgi:Transposase DNA-binding/Transposase Tn5 dimerisation domain